MFRLPSLLFVTAVLAAGAEPAPIKDAAFPVTIRVRADQPLGGWKPIWRFFGADEPNYATLPDGRKLMGELGQLRTNDVYFRTHNLLTSGDGTPALKWGSTGVYSEDAAGRPVYHWAILDRIFDSYRAAGVRPYVEIGFMPEALSVKPQPYQHHWTPQARYNEIFTGWAYPPKDYAKWAELVFQWAKHDVERYGRDDVAKWYWETWNEPNIGYWQGTPEEFFRLHDNAVAAVRRALPEARVGGPDSAGGGTKFLREFLEHCLQGTNFATGRVGTPLDFIAFHAKGAPVFTNDHVRMGSANQLRNMESAFKIIASFPQLTNKPVIIGESDPDGCAACQGDQLGYRNGAIYASYTAATITRALQLAERHGVNLEGALTWAFEFEGQPLFAGFRVLASGGVDLPVFNVFRMLSQLSGQRLAVESDAAVPLDSILKDGVRGPADVSAVATREQNRLCILLWHYHDDDLPGPEADVELTLAGLPPEIHTARVEQFRVDARHSNAFAAWQSLGSPARPTANELAALAMAGQLTRLEPSEQLHITNSQTSLRLHLPRQSVSLLKIQ
ncbi:MAG TPA: hypothetical protein VMB80_04895 [Candidatus Acidoferrum sp.]|nr:hypothetical protein [Candidatus Acidoferrum sp.]